MPASALEMALQGRRLSRGDLMMLLQAKDSRPLLAAARAVRERLHPPREVSFAVFRVINYTNVCEIGCSFCSFHARDPSAGYVLSLEEISRKAEEARALGTDQIFFQGGVNRNLPLVWFEEVFRLLHDRHGMTLRALSPVEILSLARREGLPIREVLVRLQAAGLSSLPGAGAEMLSPRVRHQLSPRKCTAEEWVEVMEQAHQLGLPGSANMVFGSLETAEDIAFHLDTVRALQDRTGGLLAFIPWTFQSRGGDFPCRTVPTDEYLKILAICRLYLDNVSNLEVSVLGMGPEAAALGLRAGGNDISSVVIEENVLESKGFASVAGAEAFLRQEGFVPVHRDMNYHRLPS